MPQINEYQRQNLASSLVGTPGVDESRQQTFNSLSQSANKVADANFALSVKRKEAMDAVLTSEQQMNANMEETKALRDHAEKYSSSTLPPAQIADIFAKEAEGRNATRMKNAPNPEVAKSLAVYQNGLHAQNYRNELSRADANQAQIAVNSIVRQQRTAEESLAHLWADKNFSEVDKKYNTEVILSQLGNTIDSSRSVINEANYTKYSMESRPGALKALSVSLLVNDPGQLSKLLTDKGKDGKTLFERYNVPPDEIATFKKQALDQSVNFKEMQQQAFYQANVDQITVLGQHMRDGKDYEAYAAAEGLGNSKEAVNLRANILNRHVDAEERVAKVAELHDTYRRLDADMSSSTTDVQKKKGKQRTKASAEDIFKFMGDVAESRALGEISNETYMNYLTKFIPALQTKAKVGPRAQQNWISKGWASAKSIHPKPETQIAVFNDFYQRYEQAGDFTDEGLSKAIIAANQNHMTNTFPKTLGLKGDINAVLDSNRNLVATGIQGKTDIKADGKIAPTERRVIETDTITKEKFEVYYDDNGNKIRETKIK